MARITVEDCLSRVDNRYALVILASKRTKQIIKGANVFIHDVEDKPAVIALREIAEGFILPDVPTNEQSA